MVLQQVHIKRSVAQKADFKKGNEMAALAATHIGFHLMGYYPITPSTEIAEELDEMYAAGEHDIRMIPADGEHSAAGICYGATLGGGRVLNATSSQGLLFSLEQLPVQSATRFPMVLNLVTRSVNAPLDIRCDHSDLYFTLNTGWIILLARSPQAVYDINIIAAKIGEHPEVRLPVIVAYDGFFTSHQKRLVHYFDNPQVVKDFVGPFQPHITALDPDHPVTIGAYMNDPDLINNKYQHKLAMDAALRVLPSILAEYGELSGRSYPLVDTYQMEDAEVALFLLNSAAETAKDAVDRLRAQGERVGVISPNVIRPFPAEELRRLLRNVKALVIGDRADSYGAGGGNMAIEVKAALKEDTQNQTLCISRVYGLGGKDFYQEDAEAFLYTGLEAAMTHQVAVSFDYYGANPGVPDLKLEPIESPIPKEKMALGLAKVTVDEATGRLKVKVEPPRKLMAAPRRIAPGHGACPGCGIFPNLNQFLLGIEGPVVLLSHTGCAEIVTTGYPYSAFRVTYVHNLFQNGAPTLAGLVEMYEERQRRGELPAGDDFTFIMVSGDGGMDIGMGPAIGAAIRNHKMIILEYDNQSYQNTGGQLSYSAFLGQATSTSHAGPAQPGKKFHHKDTAQIMAACNIPYVFTSTESLLGGMDLVRKAAKAQWYAQHEGLVYGKVFSVCPLSWRYEERFGMEIAEAAVNSCFFPVYEIEKGKTVITYDPEERRKRITLAEFLQSRNDTKHLAQPEYADILRQLEEEVERRWQRLKAKHQHPLL